MCTAAVCFHNELKPWVWFTAGLVKLKPDGVLGLQELSSLSARNADLQIGCGLSTWWVEFDSILTVPASIPLDEPHSLDFC